MRISTTNINKQVDETANFVIKSGAIGSSGMASGSPFSPIKEPDTVKLKVINTPPDNVMNGDDCLVQHGLTETVSGALDHSN